MTIGKEAIGGTLHYVTGYTGFSGDSAEQEGNYLALHFEDDGASSIAVKVIGSDKPPVTLDEDGLLVIRIRDVAEGLEVSTVKDGTTYVNRLAFTGIIREPKATT